MYFDLHVFLLLWLGFAYFHYLEKVKTASDFNGNYLALRLSKNF